MEFFHLNSDTEDKVISREQRIFTDTLMLIEGNQQTLTTTTLAPRQKIKFFLDVIKRTDTVTGEDFYYRIGEYYELEHTESVQVWNTSGAINFSFICTENAGGSFDWSLAITSIPNAEIVLYISSVVFEDSFYNSVGGWLNPDNPDNLIDMIVDEDKRFSLALDYQLFEQDTGVKWLDGKRIYKRSFTSLTNGSILLPIGYVDKLINSYGYSTATNGNMYYIPHIEGVNYIYIIKNPSTAIVSIINGSHVTVTNAVTLYYTKN